MKLRIKLSDKILLIVVTASLITVLTVFFLGASYKEIIILGGAIYISSFIIAFSVSRSFSNRIVKLSFRVQEMAAGSLSKKPETTSKDEIGQLSNAINELTSRLKTGVVQDVSARFELAQAKTDFVTLASHQLRAPLSIIKWYVDYLLVGDAGEMKPEQEKYLRQVYASNERIIDLVNALLDVSRIDVGTFSIDPEPADIIELAEIALKKHNEDIRLKHLNIEKLFDEIPVTKLDTRLMRIVFENVLSNSVKYTPDGGTVRFIIKKTEHDIYIRIMDTGCGIPREVQSKVFTKLFRADNAKKMQSLGTGLGLYIVRAVIEKSGGKIWFESPCLELLLAPGQKDADVPLDKRNRGTSVNITIPLEGMRKKRGTKKLSSVN